MPSANGAEPCMRQIWIMAAVVVSMAVGAARMADQAGRNVRAPDPTAAVVAAATTAGLPPTERIYGRDSVRVRPDLHGRFVVDARVNGRHLQFLIDTGATMVALRAHDAAVLGIHPTARDFTIPVSTANGVGRAAQAYLGMVEIDN